MRFNQARTNAKALWEEWVTQIRTSRGRYADAYLEWATEWLEEMERVPSQKRTQHTFESKAHELDPSPDPMRNIYVGFEDLCAVAAYTWHYGLDLEKAYANIPRIAAAIKAYAQAHSSRQAE